MRHKSLTREVEVRGSFWSDAPVFDPYNVKAPRSIDQARSELTGEPMRKMPALTSSQTSDLQNLVDQHTDEFSDTEEELLRQAMPVRATKKTGPPVNPQPLRSNLPNMRMTFGSPPQNPEVPSLISQIDALQIYEGMPYKLSFLINKYEEKDPMKCLELLLNEINDLFMRDLPPDTMLLATTLENFALKALCFSAVARVWNNQNEANWQLP